eukprot:4104029-Pleurochrysis_carterae.AAC.1
MLGRRSSFPPKSRPRAHFPAPHSRLPLCVVRSVASVVTTTPATSPGATDRSVAAAVSVVAAAVTARSASGPACLRSPRAVACATRLAKNASLETVCASKTRAK